MLIIGKHRINKLTDRQNKPLMKKLFSNENPDIVYENAC